MSESMTRRIVIVSVTTPTGEGALSDPRCRILL